VFDRAAALVGIGKLDASKLVQNPYVVGDATHVFAEGFADRFRAVHPCRDQVQCLCPQRVGQGLGQAVIDRNWARRHLIQAFRLI
jgi:hypothetical protein